MQSKKVIRKEQCPTCAANGNDNSKDNLAVYEDGGSWCFKCAEAASQGWAISGEVMELKSRKISKETCAFFNYQVGKHNNKWVQIANYYGQNRKLLKQKLRDEQKNMLQIGPKGEMPLYGQWLWDANPNVFVTVVEGEIDALTVVQVQGRQYPVVSVPLGAQGAVKAIAAASKWLMGFKHVVLAFDNDEAGILATQKVLESDVLDPVKVRVATWAMKDANELLLAGREAEIGRTLFMAKAQKPEPLVTVEDILDKVMERPQFGQPYPWESMTKITYGFQLGEIHIVVAANAIGKTEFVKELMFHFLEKDIQIGLFSFEQTPADTMRRLIGAKLGLKIHLPGTEWDEAAIKAEAMKLNDKIYLCDRTGSINIDELFMYIRYLSRVKDKKLFIIDNIRGLGIGHDNELAGNFMRKLQSCCLELGISVILLSHVSKDKMGKQVYVSTSPKRADEYHSMTAEELGNLVEKDGMSWESGRMPTKENVDGPSVFCDLANYVWALARNLTSSDSLEQRTLRVKAIKTRLDGQFGGAKFNLLFGEDGRYTESKGVETTDPFARVPNTRGAF